MVTGEEAFPELAIGSLLKRASGEDLDGHRARWDRATADQFEPTD